MFKKLSFGVAVLTAFASLAFPGAVFAQGEAGVCGGYVTGVTGIANVNSGATTFDAHGPTYREGDLTDLSILGLGQGYAPGDKGNAACTERVEGNYNGVEYDHRLKGFAWNENLGFISFSCESGRNRSGAIGGGALCGAVDYGVYLSTPDGDGNRTVHGYAYNGAFGYLQFDHGFAGAEVTVNAAGIMSGYAWTEAGVWLDFNNVAVEIFPPLDVLLDEEPALPLPEAPWCEDKPFLCVEVPGANPAGGGVGFGVGGDDIVRIADGRDSYYVDLYLRDVDGNALNPAEYNVNEFLDSVRLVWTDTVKRNQTNGFEANYALVSQPFTQSSGAVIFKPLSFADFEEVAPGHFRNRAGIASYAPTTAMNYSLSNGEPRFAFSNELFLSDIEGVIEDRQSNNLILKNITHGDLVRTADGETVFPAGSVFAEGVRNGVALDFAPAVEVDTLYSNAGDDSISMYRGVPANVRFSTTEYGALPDVARSSTTVDLRLGYNESDTEFFQGCSTDNFDVSFMNGFDGEEFEGGRASLRVTRENIGGLYDLQVIATVPVLDNVAEGEEVPPEEDVLPCAYAEAPTVYTEVGYSLGGRVVRYYSNKLPKTTAQVLNPSVVVHGNIYGQDIGAVSESTRPKLQGNIDTNVVRDTISASLEKYGVMNVANMDAVGGLCEITALDSVDNSVVDGFDCAQNRFRAFEIGDENVMYFKNQDVSLNLESGELDAGQWVIIVDGGNIFIDNSVNIDADASKKLTLIAFRDLGERYPLTGHGYLAGGKPMIVDSTMIFDGSLFGYSGDRVSFEVSDDGAPIWFTDFERTEALSYQALIRGSIFSDNTIGGADLDSGDNPKDYLLLGGGEVVNLPVSSDVRRRVQSFDLNYLRLFSLEVEMCENGYPTDQVCGRCLSPEDVVAISQGERLCGEKGNCAAGGNEYVCNGINPYVSYEGGANDLGDLVPPRDEDRLVSDGLDNEEDFDPIYVFFREPASDSFVFSGR